MRAVIVQNRQNVIDLATQYYGRASALVDFCDDNNLELDSNVAAGSTVLIRDDYPANADAEYADYIKIAGIVIVSLSSADDDEYSALGTNNNEFIITNDNNYIQS